MSKVMDIELNDENVHYRVADAIFAYHARGQAVVGALRDSGA